MPSARPVPPPAPHSPAQLLAAMTKVPVTARTRKQLLQRDLRRNDDVHNFGSASTVAKVGPPQILLN